jgi:hypothetical protein
MFYPLPTSTQVASHDAWLEEMRKEPSELAGRPVRPGLRQRLLLRVGEWLIATGQRLQARHRPESSVAPEAYRSAPAS